MKNERKVSVIVPVYNVEKYISRCIESLIQQDHYNIEIILVDDGSPDNSGKILDKYKEKDPRIVVIHKKNEGVSSARNIGLKTATGDYLMFVDGDDYVDKDYVSYFLKIALGNNVQMAVNKDFYNIDNNKKNKDFIEICDSVKVMEDIYIGNVDVAVWNKIYDKELIEKHNINFDPDIWYGEGMLFNMKCLQYADKVAVGKNKVYHQVFNPGSAMRNFSLKSNLCGLKSLELQKTLWKKTNKELEFSYRFHYRNFSISIINGLVETDAKKEHTDMYNKCRKNLHKDVLLPWRVPISLKTKVYCTLYAICPYIMAKRSARKKKVKIVKQIKALNE